MLNSPTMFISVIIPAYNEQSKVARDIDSAATWLSANPGGGELIVIDDGSGDETAKVAGESCRNLEIETRVSTIPHAGKGAAVRKGVSESSGDIVMFADTGLCIFYDEAEKGIEMIRDGKYDIANGSRYHPESVIVKQKGFFRRLASSLFRKVLPFLVGIRGRYTDTQCGFKVYRGQTARKLYEQCVCNGYFFDLEVILRAERKGLRVGEFPVRWTSDSDSRLSLSRNMAKVLFEVFRIRRAVKDA